MKIEISAALDWDAIKTDYQIDQRTRIVNVWQNDAAESVRECLEKRTQFSHAYTTNGRPVESSDQEMAGMSQQQRAELSASISRDASQGVGFLYGRHMIQQNSPELLQNIKAYLNSEELLQKMRDMSGFNDIKLASAQGTRYVRGNFLTRHNDILEREGRLLAYVLSFTPKWHPDCGGLLQFYQDNGTPRDAWSPVFNSMTIFDVKHVHAVTYVPPYAPIQRLSITGWFRSH
ncbi:MAG: SM-20-related protein [Paraglaciecola sp.]